MECLVSGIGVEVCFTSQLAIATPPAEAVFIGIVGDSEFCTRLLTYKRDVLPPVHADIEEVPYSSLVVLEHVS